MKQYLDLLRHVLENGTVKHDRTGTGTKSVFGYQLRCDLSQGFPLLTTVSAGAWRENMERMGRREWRPGSSVWRAVALVARLSRWQYRPD